MFQKRWKKKGQINSSPNPLIQIQMKKIKKTNLKSIYLTLKQRHFGCFIYGLFGIAFEGLKSAFNTQKARLKKKKKVVVW
jgi:hypothetical protein